MGPNAICLVALEEEIETQKEAPVETQREDGHLPANERGLGGNQHLNLSLEAS